MIVLFTKQEVCFTFGVRAYILARMEILDVITAKLHPLPFESNNNKTATKIFYQNDDMMIEDI